VTTEPTLLTILELRQSQRHRFAECHQQIVVRSAIQFLLIPLPLGMQGEELRKQIGAAAYIECSSKTQQVVMTHVE